MASGYLHQDTVQLLLNGGADPSVSDSSGKSVSDLIDSIREKIQPAQIKQRMALEEVNLAMTMHVYEDVLPAAILAVRETDEGGRQFLVQWDDGADDSWVAEDLVSESVRCYAFVYSLLFIILLTYSSLLCCACMWHDSCKRV